MNELLFTAMDIPKEIRRILNSTPIGNGMTEGEVIAYQLGTYNTISLLKSLLESDEHIVFHIRGLDMPTELDIDEIIKIVKEDM